MPEKMAKPGSRVRCIYAFVTVDDDGDEALALCHTADGWAPLLTLDRDRLPALRAVAREIGRQFGVAVELRRYENVGLAEVVGGRALVGCALEASTGGRERG